MADGGSKPNITILDFRWIYKDLLILSFSCSFGLFTYVFFFYFMIHTRIIIYLLTLFYLILNF